MNVLIIKNISNEGPGTIEDYLKEKGIEYTVADFSGCEATEDSIPDLKDYSHLIIMGGPMAIYKSEGLPFIHYEVAIIRTFAKSGKRILGICLGAQMIAHALNADVYAGGTNEVGWDRVDITREGMDDPLFSALAINNEQYTVVFHWHEDTFDLPKNSVLLASSRSYRNQAFRYRQNVYGLQFHIEVTPGIIREWFDNEEEVNSQEMIDHAGVIFAEYRERAFRFYESFFN